MNNSKSLVILFVGIFFFSIFIFSCSENDNSSTLPENEAPFSPSNPDPPDSSLDREPDLTLSWACSDPDEDTLSYFLHFGTNTQPNLIQSGLSDTFFTVADLELSTNYYWKVVAHDNNGHMTAGPTWTFGTRGNLPPFQPDNPYPADSTENIPIDVLWLRWTGGDPDDNQISYDLYLGTSNPPPLYQEALSDTTYQLTGLEPGATYYWQIVAKDEALNTSESPVWMFSTAEVYIWTRTFGGSDNDAGYYALTRPEGGYVVSGAIRSQSGSSDFYLMAVDDFGEEIWSNSYGTPDRDYIGYEFDHTHDGGYIIGGTTYMGSGFYYPLLIKTDNSGNMEWSTDLENENNTRINVVKKVVDGGFIIYGITDISDDTVDLWLARTSSTGDVIWERTFSSEYSYRWANDLIITDDGGYLLNGAVDNSDHTNVMIKTDEDGIELWRQYIPEIQFVADMVSTPSGGYILGGDIDEENILHFVSKCVLTNQFGTYLYSFNQDTDNSNEWCFGFGTTFDFQYISTGYKFADESLSNPDIFFRKFDINGNLSFEREFDTDGNDEAHCIIQTNDYGYLIVGSTDSYGAGGSDILLIKTDSSGNMLPVGSGLKKNVRGPSGKMFYDLERRYNK